MTHTITSSKADYIFEVSWETCNKIGGVHKVLASKADDLHTRYGDRFVLIGPDIRKEDNSEFIEDNTLFALWREHALAEGLKLRIGRWNIACRPIVILIDFTSFFALRNDIFTGFWDNYHLDSISGQWDYIEPALFGYAAGKAINSYYRYHFNANDRIIAQFHDWTTGAGILYLKKDAPQIATVFTAHSTVLGRVIAGSGGQFYKSFDSYNPDKAAADYNVVAKHSLERISAANADSFTTVSDLTARECIKFLGRTPDVITPNGIDPNMVPDHKAFDAKRRNARKKVFAVVEALTNQKINEEALLVLKSGRYEYRNKGIDIFINSLKKLSDSHKLKKTVVAVILVPSAQAMPVQVLKDNLGHPDFDHPNEGRFITHDHPGMENDKILLQIKATGLHNDIAERVKIVYAPVYLNKRDGIFDLDYYDLLIGFDLSVFPSYYEPWGYSALESLAFHIPSVITSVSGFGVAVRRMLELPSKGVYVLEHTDDNQQELEEEIASIILHFSEDIEIQRQIARAEAYRISNEFLWGRLITFYEQAYLLAIEKSNGREQLFKNQYPYRPVAIMDGHVLSKPFWRSISIQALLPPKLAGLHKLSSNLWWSWNYNAAELFANIDPQLWDDQKHNPILLLQQLGFEKIRDLEKDESFLKKLNACVQEYDQYLAVPKSVAPQIAYFSMEYGIANFMKLYSGGLGVLAGDYLKEASDQNQNMIAVGLLYKNGYFRQNFTSSGTQLAEADIQEVEHLPLQLVKQEDGSPLLVSLFFPGRTVFAQIWKLPVGRVSLYLLDTNIKRNTDEDKAICSQLYDGESDLRLKQELLLGIGGIRALNAMNIQPDVFHCNEGHAAFINIQRIQQLIVHGKLRFEEAVEVVRSSTLFTTHTAVPAANDLFTEDQLRTYFSENVQVFNIEWDTFMGLGRENPKDSSELFSMTYLAARLSQEINSVSKIHQLVSCRLLSPLWKNFQPGELHIRNVTNGVHFETWTHKRWQKLYRNTWGAGFSAFDKADFHEKMEAVSDAEIWSVKTALKKELVSYIRKKISSTAAIRKNAKRLLKTAGNISENALFIGFARRFATYKRSHLLFSDLERLARIVNNAEMPVHILFSGKAHPRDEQGKELIRTLLETIQKPDFSNAILFLEDYDIDTAARLVQGVDLWLNTPFKNTEASGTSGIKAAMNGALHCSVLDGWWNEAYHPELGWMINNNADNDKELQNQMDAETLYSLLENEIIPLFFERDYEGLPVKWIEMIRRSVTAIVPGFSMSRVLKEYNAEIYTRLYERGKRLKDDQYAIAKRLSAWKGRIVACWPDIQVISINLNGGNNDVKTIGDRFVVEIVLQIGQLCIEDIGLEIVVVKKEQKPEEQFNFSFSKEFTLVHTNGMAATFNCSIPLGQSGVYDYSFRVFPRSDLLPHRQDFPLIMWI